MSAPLPLEAIDRARIQESAEYFHYERALHIYKLSTREGRWEDPNGFLVPSPGSSIKTSPNFSRGFDLDADGANRVRGMVARCPPTNRERESVCV